MFSSAVESNRYLPVAYISIDAEIGFDSRAIDVTYKWHSTIIVFSPYLNALIVLNMPLLCTVGCFVLNRAGGFTRSQNTSAIARWIQSLAKTFMTKAQDRETDPQPNSESQRRLSYAISNLKVLILYTFIRLRFCVSIILWEKVWWKIELNDNVMLLELDRVEVELRLNPVFLQFC